MLNMILHYYFFFNIFLVCLLLVLMGSTKKITYQLFYIFVYFSFHYAYGILPIFAPDFGTVFNLQRNGDHSVVNFLAIFFLMAVLAILIIQNKCIWSLKNWFNLLKDKKMQIYGLLLLTWLSVSALYYIINPDFIAKKLIAINLYTLLATAVFVILFSNKPIKIEIQDIKQISYYVFSILLLTVSIQAIQFWLGKAWICCDIVRPDAFLFNPNNLGFWLLTVSAFFFYLYISGISKRLAMIAQILICSSLLLAASRSFFVSVIFFHCTLILTTWFFAKNELGSKCKLIGIFYILLSIFCLSLQIIPIEKVGSSIVLSRLQVNSDRLIYTPAIIYQYITGNNILVKKLEVTNEQHIQSTQQIETKDHLNDHLNDHLLVRNNLKQGGVVNIQNRLSSEATDNAYAVSFKRTGFMAAIFWLIVLCAPLYFMNRELVKVQSIRVLISFYLAILFSGITLDIFIIFPSCGILAMTYALILGIEQQYKSKQIIKRTVTLKNENLLQYG